MTGNGAHTQVVTKIAVASIAMLLLGTSASIAQPYGYGPYGYGPIGSNGPTPGYCGPMTSQITNWIIDPMTGQAITQAQYLARYPWSNPATWSYSCDTGLWTDPGVQSNSGYYYDQYGQYRQTYPGYPPPPVGYAVPAPPPPAGIYYRQGRYENDCRQGNAVAGTIFGALAGGLLGSAASHGSGGAVVGGAVLGGLLGNTISREIDCEDQPYAFNVYATGLNGEIGRRYDWRHGDAHGEFTPVREFHRGGEVCRDFRETSYRGRETHSHNGTACRGDGGHWRFD